MQILMRRLQVMEMKIGGRSLHDASSASLNP
jgi:hypothetical protein